MGLGYVGLPLAVAFAEQGHDIVGVDIDARKVEGLSRGESHIEDIDSERLRAVASRLEITTRFSNLSRCDAVLVCVPTPLTHPTASRTSDRWSPRHRPSPTSCSPTSSSSSSRRPTPAPRASAWSHPR